jgi:hypothetical protein
MRRELRAPRGAETLTYSFHFQISNNGGRQAFSVEVQAPNVQDATTFFRQNLLQIESIARDHLVNGIGDPRVVRRVRDVRCESADVGQAAIAKTRNRRANISALAQFFHRTNPNSSMGNNELQH